MVIFLRGMNTDLTDTERALVADLFERQRGRGTLPEYARKQMVDACVHIVRTGCAWRLLPKSFPSWCGVYKDFSRRAAAGVFEAMPIGCARCGATAQDVTRSRPR